MRPHGVLAPLLAAALIGCGALDPYPTGPGPATPGAASPRVAICYNGLETSLAEVQTQAQRQCPAGTTAEPEQTDFHLQTCPILLPARANFTCAKK